MDNISFCAPKHYESQLLLTCFSNNLPQVSKLSCFPLTKFPIKPPKFVPLKATCNDQETIRTYKKLPPSPWTDYFHSLSIDISEMDELRKEIDLLKLKAKNTIMSIDSRKKRILMIYLLVSLGLSYHFEEEITKTLKEGFEKKDEMLDGEEDLYTVSIIFWVFRKYGHYISSDVFKRFKGNNGKFKESLKRDIKGILGLYEAAHMRTTKDHILDEAFRFTSNQLELVAEIGTCPPHLSTRIRNALSLSQHWNMETIAAVEYISFYEHEKGHDEMLLKFAKTSFKYVKLHYLQDLKVILKWYKEVDFESNLPPYFKDRIVENSFTIQAVFFDPQASRARIMYSQFYTLLGILDDTLDRYASIHEAETLSKNFQRWASDHTMDKQPDYLKFVFNFVVDTFKMFEKELRPEEKLYTVKATIEEYKILVKANCQHRRWVQAAHVPSFDEYMAVAEVMLTVYVSLAGAAMSLGEIATKEVFVWLKSRPKYVQSISMKGRLVNDIYGFEDDMNRGNVANAVNCYMKQYEVTKQEAIKELLKMVADADKTINEGLLTTTAVSRSVLKAALTIAQIIAVCYNGYEGFTNPEGKFKEYIVMVLLD